MISPVARQILSCTARSAVFRPSSVVAAVPRRFVSNKTLDPILYEAVGTSTGSRADGHAATNAGNLSVKMQMPKELGGKDHAQGVSDPEQLFSLAYSTCFLSALAATHQNLHKGAKPLGKDTQVRARVALGKPANGMPGFLLSLRLEVAMAPLRAAGLDAKQAKQLVEEAHKLCPYSRAVAGNVEVEIQLNDK